MDNLGTALAHAWATTLDFIKWAGPALKSGVLVAAGRVWQGLVESLEDSKANTQQLKEILDAEKINATRPVNGAADRLQHGSFSRPRAQPRK